jgi:TPR repeat protein
LNDGGGCALLGLLFLTPLPSLYINPRLEQPLLSFKSHAFWKNLSDDFKAVKFYQKACGLNDGGGCALLGFMYERGKASLYINPRIEQPLPEFKPHAFWKNLSALPIILSMILVFPDSLNSLKAV